MSVPDWARANQSKKGATDVKHGVVSKPSPFHAPKVQHLADGTPSEEDFKRMGLEASARDVATERSLENGPVEQVKGGFSRLFDRFRAGNIDDPSSRAYNEMGAGRGRMEYEKQQQFKQNEKDAAARTPDMMTGDDLARRMGRTPAMTTAPAPDSNVQPVPQPEMEWKALQSSSDKPAVAPSQKPVADFSSPTLPVVENKPENAEPAPARRAAPKRKRPEPRPAPAPAAENTAPVRAPAKDVKAAPEKPGARGGNNAARKSKPYPKDARPKVDADTAATDTAQAAGRNYAQAKKALDSLPKDADMATRKRLQNAADSALRDYEAASQKLKRK